MLPGEAFLSNTITERTVQSKKEHSNLDYEKNFVGTKFDYCYAIHQLFII
jgi:hypothetical protein